MRPLHLAMALAVVVIWGVNFVVIRFGLDHFPPLLLVALRFAICALPAMFVKRPAISWPRLILTGLCLFGGQFALLFTGMSLGLPPGLASILSQGQAFVTPLIAWGALGERPTGRQAAGTAVAVGGLAAIVCSAGVDAPLVGILFGLGAATSWAVGNVLLRGAGRVDMLAMMIWLSLVAFPPLTAMSFLLEGREAIVSALSSIGPREVTVLLYLAVLSTLVGYGSWGQLLKLYPVATVVPFSLLVPIVGAVAASLVLGEHFGPIRLLGAALVVGGVAVVALPLSLMRRLGRGPKNCEADAI